MNKKSDFLEVMISMIFLICLIMLFLQRDIDGEYITILVVASLSVSIITVIFSLMKYLRNTISDKRIERAEEELHSKEYSLMREHLEHEISNLQKKLINSGKDWESINHLPLSAQKREYDNGPVQITNFIKRFGLTENDITIDKKMVFFLTPFSKENVDTYLSTKEICSECGLNLYRGDEEFAHEDILTNIIKYIVQARIIIANIDGKNPNVFYELGIAHSLGKPTILISKTPEKTPFDIQQNRIIFFTNSEDLKAKLSKELSIYENGERTQEAGKRITGDADPDLGKFLKFEEQPKDPAALRSVLWDEKYSRDHFDSGDIKAHIEKLSGKGKKPSLRAQLAKDKETVKATPKRQAAKTKNKGLEV